MTTQTLYLIDEYLTQGGYTPGIDAETLEREAHLIAAAPELLAALQEVLSLCEGECAIGHICLNAIAKAKGEDA
jgi:hypothetical protein